MLDPRATPERPAEAARPRKILLADDDERSRRLLGESLRAAGFEVWTAADGVAAIEAIEAAPPDLLVLDFEMPGLDGAELCRRIRTADREAVRQLPVIVLTGHTGEAEEIGCLAAGANDFVTKPVGRQVLLARIDTQLRLGALGDELRARNDELARWRDEQEADLDAARTTQQALVSSVPPKMDGWQAEVLYAPLIQVGGDIYGWRRLPEGRWLFWLADATGHGVAAALFTTLAALLFNHAEAGASSADEILAAVNAEFWSVFRGKSFMTACCALIGPDGSLGFAGAGHPALLVRRSDGSVEEARSLATMIGVHRTLEHAPVSLQLAPGDVALLYSDGLFGLRMRDGERMDFRDVAREFGRLRPGAGIPLRLGEALRAAAGAEGFTDDLAVIALSRE
jgi:sigma-B regulation protein RsbU (phosphoserine phosphatase)